MTRQEAIDKLKHLCSPEQMTALKVLVPELQESEDERIRKWLIKAIHLIGVDKDICADQETMDKAIAWLEKQKYEYEVFEPIENTLEYKAGFKAGIESEKQKEQKPLSTEETELNSIAFLEQLGYTCIPSGAKPEVEWSEEDEEMLDAMIDIVSNSLYEPLCPREGMLSWLKSLRSRPKSSDNWKPSKEQMKALKNCVNGWQDTADGPLESLYTDLKKLM